MTSQDGDCGALAAALVDGAATVSALAPLDAAQRTQLAWALKDETNASWIKSPPRTGLCAAWVARLRDATPAGAASAEISALADWTCGVAALADSRIDEALAALDRARLQLAGLGLQHAAAQTAVPQVVALSLRGRHGEALALGREALAAFVVAGDARSAGKMELNLATLLTRLEQAAEALPLYRSAAVRFARIRDVEHSVLADIGLANALTMLLDLGEARRINERASMRAAQHALPVLQAHAQAAIGRLELRHGHHGTALKALAESVHLLETAQAGPHRLLEAETALAQAYAAVRLLPEAARLYSTVAQRAQQLGAPGERAWALLHGARAHSGLGQFRLADAHLEEAARLFAQLGHSVGQALADLALGDLRLGRGDAPAALAAAQRAAQALVRPGVTAWALEARLLAAEAELAGWRAGPRDDGTAARLVASLAEVEKACAELAPLRQRCRLAQAMLALALGQRNEARSCLLACMDDLDSDRALLPDDEFRAAVAAHGEVAHRALVELVWADGDGDGDGDAVALLAMLERGRNRAALMDSPARPSADDHPSLRAARERLLSCRERHRRLTQGGGSVDQGPAAEARAAEMAELQRNLRDAEHGLLEARRRALLGTGEATRSSLPELLPQAAAELTARPGDWAARLCDALGPARALVEFHVQPGLALAVVVTSEGVRAVALDAPDLQARVEALHFQMDGPRFGQTLMSAGHAAQLLQRVRSHAQGLYKRLWAPLLHLLAGRRDIVVVPHGPLHDLPFAALHDGDDWLVQTHCLRLAPGAAAWLAMEPPPGRVCLSPAQDRGAGGPDVVALASDDHRLPHVAAEVGAVCVAHGPGAVALLGPLATRNALRSAATHSRVLHLACHGQFRADNPAFSNLQLADGPLALHELTDWRLAAELVVLSACDTARGQRDAGNEVLGLVRALRRAGVRDVVATQWAVQDEATASLMARLHQGLAAGLPTAQALRQAQSEAAARGQHPFFWAAFVLHGG